MSPLLGISLAIIVLLWVIPLAWAISKGFRALPGLVGELIGFFRDFSKLRKLSEGERQLLRKELQLEADYQNLQDELVRVRALLARTVSFKKELLTNIRSLTTVISESDAIQRCSDNEHLSSRERLKELEREAAEVEFKIASLRFELEEKELGVMRAYSRKQVVIAKDKADYATEKARKILELVEAQHAENPLLKMELKVRAREASANAGPGSAASQQDLSTFVEAISRLQIESMPLENIQKLIQPINDVVGEVTSLVLDREAIEELLSMQVSSSKADLQSWKRKAAEAAAEDRPLLVKQAEVNQLECEVQIAKQERQLEEARSKLADLKLLEMKLSKRKGEILMRIADLEPRDMDFSPGE